MKLPLEAFVFSMEMLVKSMQGLQAIAYQGIDTIVGGVVQTSGHRPGSQSNLTNDIIDGTTGDSAERMSQTTQGEEKTMAEMDSRNEDYLKLYRYKILFVKRDLEHAFPEKEELVSENTDTAGYTAWKLAEFIQDLPSIETPRKWQDKKYPPADLASPPRAPGMIYALPEDDKKYLRVYYEVLERYPRERFRYEERQIEVLEQIRDKMKDS